MTNTFDVFCNDCLLNQKHKQNQAEAIIWYHYKTTGANEITLKELNDYFIQAHLPQINISRIKNSFTQSKKVCKGKEVGTYRLSLTAMKIFDDEYGYIFSTSEDRIPFVDLNAAPFVAECDVDMAQDMAHLYEILHCYENSARNLIVKVLKQHLGENWSDSALNSTQKNKISSRKDTEKRNQWLTPRGGSDLFYLDWSDLLTIIRKYEALFLPYVKDIKFIELRFEELERVRNIIAHHGYLANREDFQRVILSFNDWCRQVKSSTPRTVDTVRGGGDV